MKDLCVVLVRPRNPNNIGACARAMCNFGLADLRIVDPFEPIWKETVSAVGADEIIEHARIFSSLSEALADTHLSLAATALRNREVHQKVVFLPQLTDYLQARPAGRTALVFGNEKTGLSNEDIARCTAILNIPTAVEQPSINLAQAVILTCYELSKGNGFTPLGVTAQQTEFPTDAQKEIVVQSIDELFEKIHFKTNLTAAQRKTYLRHILAAQTMDRWQLFFVKAVAEKIKQQLP